MTRSDGSIKGLGERPRRSSPVDNHPPRQSGNQVRYEPEDASGEDVYEGMSPRLASPARKRRLIRKRATSQTNPYIASELVIRGAKRYYLKGKLFGTPSFRSSTKGRPQI